MKKNLSDESKKSINKEDQQAISELTDLQEMIFLNYKGYKAEAKFSNDDKVYVGKKVGTQ